MGFRGRGVSARRERGQAIPIGIAAILFTMMLSFALFNTAQLTSDKMRLTNTADAAAYSGLVWEARTLNFYAYTNRAMVANQVSIAQVVSFVSWSRYLKVAARNLNIVAGWTPYLGPFIQMFARIADNIDRVVTQIGNTAIPIIDTAIEGLMQAQRQVHYATLATTQQVVREVVKANDPQFELTGLGVGWLAQHANDWNQFTAEYRSAPQLLRKADLITRSRDPWTKARDWDIRVPSLLDLWGIQIYVRKRGETRLLNQGPRNRRGDSRLQWEWKAKDTLSMHVSYYCIKRWRITTCRFEVPLGWGGAYASTTNRDIDNAGCNGWYIFCGNNYWSVNRRAESLANGELVSLKGYNGVRSYREIADLRNTADGQPKLELKVEVRKRGQHVRTTTKAGFGSPQNPDATMRRPTGRGLLRLNDKLADDEVSALSRAELYFQRPVRRSDGRKEYGNLFNPYWDVRLAQVRPSDRRIAWGIKGIADLSPMPKGADER